MIVVNVLKATSLEVVSRMPILATISVDVSIDKPCCRQHLLYHQTQQNRCIPQLLIWLHVH